MLLAVSSYGLYRTFASPSGQTQSIEGGGFCHGTYTVYNNTVDKLIYAMNCSTGVNDIAASSDWGNVMTTLVKSDMPTGGEIDIRHGLYSEITVFNLQGFTLNSASPGLIISGAGNGFTTNGTVIEAKTNGMTMIESSGSTASVVCPANNNCSGAPTVQFVTFQNFALWANQKATVGIDFRMTEESTQNSFINLAFLGQINIYGTGQSQTGFTVCMYLDGNEDSYVDNVHFYDSANTGTDIQWQVPLGNVNLRDDFIGAGTGGTTVNLAYNAQNVYISGGVLNTIKQLATTGFGNSSTAGDLLYLSGIYMANPTGATSHINLNGNVINSIAFSGDLIGMNINMFSGTGTVNALTMNGCELGSGNGIRTNWNLNGATIQKQISAGGNHINGDTPTNFPFTIDANGNF